MNHVDQLKNLCDLVQKEGNTHINSNLESFLNQLILDLQNYCKQQKIFEEALRSRDEEHSAQIETLYQEIESHLTEEKENAMLKEFQKILQENNRLQQELELKEGQLLETLCSQKEVFNSLKELEAIETFAKEEIKSLVMRKESLEAQLDQKQSETTELQQSIDQFKKIAVLMKQEHISFGFKTARRIYIEQKGLLSQLCLLRQTTEILEGGTAKETSFKINNEKVRNSVFVHTHSNSFETTSDLTPSGEYEYDEDFLNMGLESTKASDLLLQNSKCSGFTLLSKKVTCLQDEFSSLHRRHSLDDSKLRTSKNFKTIL